MTKPERRAAVERLARGYRNVMLHLRYTTEDPMPFARTLSAIRNRARSLCGKDAEMWREFQEGIGE